MSDYPACPECKESYDGRTAVMCLERVRASLEAVSDLLPQGTLDRGLEVIARFAGSE